MPKPGVGRLTLRVEGDNWNAYYAMVGTMDQALYLGSIAMSLVQNNRNRKHAFMNLMRDACSELISEITGRKVVWKHAPKVAPPHERTGSS